MRNVYVAILFLKDTYTFDVGRRSQSQLKVPRPAIGRPTWKWGRILGPFICLCPEGTRPMSACVPAIPMRY